MTGLIQLICNKHVLLLLEAVFNSFIQLLKPNLGQNTHKDTFKFFQLASDFIKYDITSTGLWEVEVLSAIWTI